MLQQPHESSYWPKKLVRIQLVNIVSHSGVHCKQFVQHQNKEKQNDLIWLTNTEIF